MKIGIDIDGTVTENFNLIKNLACGYFKKNELDINTWEWDISKIFNVTKTEVDKFWELHEKLIFTLPGPKPFAKEIIAMLSQEHEIIYITARSESYRLDTIHWLKSHDIYFDRLFMVEDKLKVCLEEGISLMIDDSPEYIAIADHINLIFF